MEEFTIGTATVRIGCQTATDDQVIAAGPIDEDTDHDVEWVFFDRPLTCTPDLTMTLSHRAIGDGDDEAEWKVSFTVKALMGDHTLRDCALSFSGVSFDEDRRIAGPLPFSITLSKWRAWEKVSDSSQTQQWLVADRQPWNTVYYDYCDVFAFDRERRLAQRRLDACLTPSPWTSLPRDGGPSFDGPSSSLAISVWPQNLLFLATSGSALFATWLDASASWTRWQRFEPWVYLGEHLRHPPHQRSTDAGDTCRGESVVREPLHTVASRRRDVLHRRRWTSLRAPRLASVEW
jgi:hypothetical protein